MEEPGRIFTPISGAALEEELFEENLTQDKISDEVCSIKISLFYTLMIFILFIC